ncbi:hypothetical protein AX17_007467 [Amanita inopinata Kibby_2008]|nr:hypothetical protein AX17_007467 [Amanita inopinata Kibby_2008]
MVEQMEQILRTYNIGSFHYLQRKFTSTLSSQERLTYERLTKRLEPTDEAVEPTVEILTIIAFFSGSFSRTVDLSVILRIGHIIATMKDYAKAFVILGKHGLEAGKAAFAAAAQSAKLVNDILQDDDKLTRYASRSARLLKIVASVGFDPHSFISSISQAANEPEQKERLQRAIQDLYIRRMISLSFERLCDAIMIQDGLMLSYMTYLTGNHQLHANEMAKMIVNTVSNAWYKIDTPTSVNILAENDSHRSSWTQDDPNPLTAIAEADEMKAQIGISAAIQEQQQAPGYDFEAIANLYLGMGHSVPSAASSSSQGDTQAEILDIDRLFSKFLPYSTT